MRLLTMLATTVLLAACVHDTDDFNLFVAESGASLTYYIGGEKNGGEDDPWNTIGELFPTESVHTGKSGHDDPWDTIGEKFGSDSVHNGDGKKSGEPDDPWDTITDKFGIETAYSRKSEEEDPWDEIDSLFPSESVHRGKTDDRYFLGFEKSVAVFISFSYEVSSADRARVVEVRGNVLKLEFADGVVQYVVDGPVTWAEGTQLVTGFVDATSKKDCPFLGVRVWRTVEGDQWGLISRNATSEVPATWPRECYVPAASKSGGRWWPVTAGPETPARVAPDTINGELVWPDPWDQISEPTLGYSW